MTETAYFDGCLSVKLYRCSNIVKKQLLFWQLVAFVLLAFIVNVELLIS